MSRKAIPKPIRNAVWDLYIGKEKGIGQCFICGNEINSKSFECGHITSVSNKGDNNIDNLRPICSDCNKSMGTMDLLKFKEYIGGCLKSKNQDIMQVNEIKNKFNDIKNEIDVLISKLDINISKNQLYETYVLQKTINNNLTEMNKILDYSSNLDTLTDTYDYSQTCDPIFISNDEIKNDNKNIISQKETKAETSNCVQIDTLTCETLRKVCKDLNVSQTGTKQTLIDRVMNIKILTKLTYDEIKDTFGDNECNGNKQLLINKLIQNNVNVISIISKNKVVDLCKKEGLSITGNKKALIERLLQNNETSNELPVKFIELNNEQVDDTASNKIADELYYVDMTCDELRAICKDVNIPQNGNKQVLDK